MSRLETLLARMLRLPNRQRWQLWLCALVVGAALGLGGVPEGGLRSARALLRQHKVAAQETIVAIDDASIAAVGQWPFPRSTFGRLVDALFAQGASRVFFDLNFSTSQSPREDAAFAAALRRHPGRVFLGVHFEENASGRRAAVLPIPAFARAAQPTGIALPYSSTGEVWLLPYSFATQHGRFPGLAAQLADRPSDTDTLFPIDTSIAPDSVPVVSVADVLKGGADRRSLAGRTVVVGATSETLKDIYFLRPFGPVANPLVFALGAESLRAGHPVDLGWLPAWVLATAVGFATLRLRTRRRAILATAASAAALVLAFFVAPTTIFFSVVPAMAVLLVLAAADGFRLVREMLTARATTNQVSGLLNLAALRQSAGRPDARLVVARIHNFAEVIAALPADAETALVTQIASRLKLGMTGGELFHGDNGVFAWFATESVDVVGERLDGLHQMFRSAVTAHGSAVDLVVTFGVDDGGDRSVANRLGSALVAAAEAAADGAKWRAFDTAKLADAAWKLSLLSQLDAAIDDGHLWVAYQPKLDLRTRRLVGAEALVRWTHPEKGAISPIEFVAAAEQHNRIEKLTQHVLHRAVLAAATINAHDIDFGIAVNLSARLLESRDVIGMVADALSAHRLEPGRLTLEITETAALVGGDSHQILTELRAIGVHISIDDYGTGLSNLEYLRKIPASEIKIDRSFVQAMLASTSDLLMINSTIQLAHSLGHHVVAEGVETDEALAKLSDLGCDIAQGYRIGRPMTFQDLARRILAERKHAA